MSEKSLIVCANGDGNLEAQLYLALLLANRIGCEIRVLAFSVQSSPNAEPGLIGMSGASGPDLPIGESEVERTIEWRRVYDRFAGSHGFATGESTEPGRRPAIEWVDVPGTVAANFASYARACDFIVAGGCSDDHGTSTLDDEVSRIALLDSGRLAILAVGAKRVAADPFRRLLIAWDDGPAVARTIAQAGSLIAAATEVCLFVVEREPGSATACNQILAYLRRLNPCTTVEAAPLHGSVGHAILAKADSWNAAMIVMGSYEHSRERELLLGGTTRRVIANAKCAVALAK